MTALRGIATGVIGAALGWVSYQLSFPKDAQTRSAPRTGFDATAVTLGAAVLCGTVAAVAGAAWRGAFLTPFAVVLVVCGWIDARTRVIPNRITYPALAGYAVAVVAIGLAGGPVGIGGACLGFALFGGGLLAVALAVPNGMGMGDVKLAALEGLVLGGFGMRLVGAAAFSGLVTGAVASIALLLTGAGRKATLAFGPYLAIGGAIGAFLAARAGS